MMSGSAESRQVQKTRSAILDAFNEMVLSRPYKDIKIADIIDAANVGRSTFYEHFSNKDELLRQSMAGVLTVFADAVLGDPNLDHLVFILKHIEENLTHARAVLSGPSSDQPIQSLASIIVKRVQSMNLASTTFGVPLDLIATQIAESQLGLVRAWLRNPSACSLDGLAQAIGSSGQQLGANYGLTSSSQSE